MDSLRQLGSRLSRLFRRRDLEAEMAEEMRQHLERRTQEKIADGLSPDEARYAAQREFGGIAQLQEQCRDEHRFMWLEQFQQDVRYGLRQLRRNPGFTAVVVLTLAVGIGLNTMVFTFYSAVALKPLAVRAPAEIVRLFGADGRRAETRFTYDEFEAIAAQARSFAAVIATSSPQPMPLVRLDRGEKGARPEMANIRLVSENYFSAFGVAPVLGRSFGGNDATGAVLSHEFWSRQFGADPAVPGQTLVIHGVPVTILGVAPESFAGTGLPASTPDVWLPLSLQPAVMPGADWLHHQARQWQILARRKPEVLLEQANAELRMLSGAAAARSGRPVSVEARPATFFQTDSGEFKSFRVVALIMMAAVGTILLIGGVNVLNLLAARNAAREREFAVRLALGAGRRRLVRQLCTESVLLGLLGGAGGLALSWWFCDILRLWVVETFQRLSSGRVSVFLNVTPDWPVFAYTLGLSLLAGIAVGVWPALRATRGNLEGALKQDPASVGRSTRGRWSRRNLLLTAQVASSLVLLAGAGLAFRGAWRTRNTDPGYDTSRLFVLDGNLERQSITRLRALPEVASVAWANHPPFLGHSIRGFRNQNGGVDRWVLNGVSDTFFETVGLPLVAGRTFTAQEMEQHAAVAVINESAARQMWPGRDPIGQPLAHQLPSSLEPGAPPATFTVIGVVRDARLTVLTKQDKVDVFLPQSGIKTVLVRSRVAPDVALPAIFGALGSVDANLPSQTVVLSLEQRAVRVQQLMSNAPAAIATALGLIALLLASVGIYGVVSFLVARRTREIGVRIALGARNRDVVTLMLRQTLQPAAWGAGLGLVGAIGLSGLLTQLLVNPELPDFTDAAAGFPAATLLGVFVTLLAVVLAAAFIPARRATKVDPMVALRCE